MFPIIPNKILTNVNGSTYATEASDMEASDIPFSRVYQVQTDEGLVHMFFAGREDFEGDTMLWRYKTFTDAPITATLTIFND